jgi:CRP-like cAMP-binding protein
MKGRRGERLGFVATRRTRLRDGERTNASGKPVRNKILLSISDAEYRKIRPALEFVDLPHHFNLHEPSERVKFGYFLNSGLASIVVATKGGRDVEAGVVGREGFVGTPLAVGLDRSPLNEVMQIAGRAFRVSGRALQTVLQSAPDLQVRLSRYAVLQGMQVAQTAACNRLHDVAQRLARWLLMAQDRIDAGVLPITHDFLAVMLGTDRPSVSLAAGALQEKRVIRYRRGNVEILNRKKLEASACVCYGVVQHLNGELGLK